METSFFDELFLRFRQIMPKNHAYEEKQSKCTKEPSFSNNCKFLRSSRIIVPLKKENDAWQAIIDQPL